jgi:Secretion system C-terminal sorting domain
VLTNYYDTLGNLSSEITEGISGSNFINNSRRLLAYNSYNQLIESITQIWQNGTWKNTYKQHWYYNDPFSVVNENIEVNGLSIYPNPSAGLLTIRSNKHKLENINVYNLLGELVNSQQRIGSNAISIDLSQEAKGIYFIRTEDEYKNISTKKIVVQ